MSIDDNDDDNNDGDNNDGDRDDDNRDDDDAILSALYNSSSTK